MADISSMDDIQRMFKGTIAEFMENGPEAELDEELGYSKYDYKNKKKDNSRNGYSSKRLNTGFGEIEVQYHGMVFIDAIHYHVRSEGQIVKSAVCIATGFDLEGGKDVFEMRGSENGSVKFWAAILRTTAYSRCCIRL